MNAFWVEKRRLEREGRRFSNSDNWPLKSKTSDMYAAWWREMARSEGGVARYGGSFQGFQGGGRTGRCKTGNLSSKGEREF